MLFQRFKEAQTETEAEILFSSVTKHYYFKCYLASKNIYDMKLVLKGIRFSLSNHFLTSHCSCSNKKIQDVIYSFVTAQLCLAFILMYSNDCKCYVFPVLIPDCISWTFKHVVSKLFPRICGWVLCCDTIGCENSLKYLKAYVILCEIL